MYSRSRFNKCHGSSSIGLWVVSIAALCGFNLPAFSALAAAPSEASTVWTQPATLNDPEDLSVAAQFSWVDDHAVGGLSTHVNFGLNPNTLAFVELSAAKGDEELALFSAGLGLRRLLSDGQTVVGVNAFYDALQEEDGFTYSQIGVGLEVSRGRWFMDANGYIPVGDDSDAYSRSRTVTTHSDHHHDGGVDQHHRYREVVEWETAAMKGWDIEAGVQMYKDPKFLQALLAVGYYRYWEGGYDEDGIKVRGEVRLGRHVRLGAEWRQNGHAIGQEWRVGISLEYALGRVPKPAAPAPAVVRAPLERDGKDAKSVVPVLSGKSPKSVVPVQPGGKGVVPVQEAPPPALLPPASFFDPVYRTPWPTVMSRRTSHLYELTDPSHPKMSPFCGCKGGATLIFP